MLLYTVREAGEQLGIGRNAVYTLINTGELRVVNVAGAGKRPKLRVRADDLQRFVDANTHDPLKAPTQAFDAAR